MREASPGKGVLCTFASNLRIGRTRTNVYVIPFGVFKGSGYRHWFGPIFFFRRFLLHLRRSSKAGIPGDAGLWAAQSLRGMCKIQSPYRDAAVVARNRAQREPHCCLTQLSGSCQV